MAKNKKHANVSPTQAEFMASEAEYTLFCGGLGSGKTHAGAMWSITMALRHPQTKGLITANSYRQLKTATLSKLFELLDDLEIPFEYRKNEGQIEIGNSLIDCVSMENYNLLRGPEYGWSWSDECAFYKEEAFNVLIGRIRDNKGPCQWKGTTTPNGFNWLYTAFVESPLNSSRVVYSRTTDNLSNLKSSYVDTLREQYDSKLAEQELDGQFVNLTSGKVYHAFDRYKNLGDRPHTRELIYIGLDFNVHPMCGIYCYEHNGKIYVFDELYLEDSNTFKAAKEILRRFPYQTLRIVPDETGNRRRSSSKSTDHEILRRANLDVEKFRNPGVRDRQNNINRLFEHGKLVISPNCKQLIKDLEQLVHENKDDMLGHITDALGYACWHLNPLKKPKRKARVFYQQ